MLKLLRPMTSAEASLRKVTETNDLGFVASLLFVLVPTVFLIILYIQTNSRQG